MTKSSKPREIFHSAAEDKVLVKARETKGRNDSQEQLNSNSYKLVYDDAEFLLRDEMRAVRLQLEYAKPDMVLDENGIQNTVVIFGSARTPDAETLKEKIDRLSEQLAQEPDNKELLVKLSVAKTRELQVGYYTQARRLGQLITEKSGLDGVPDLHVVTGGGPGIMEAANRGASEVGGKSVGHNIVLQHEQYPNQYITPELCFNFHYFAMRKMHLLVRAKAVVVFPGGFGTLDELFETLTLVQTEKIRRIPIIIFGEEYWRRLIDFDLLLAEGMITSTDLEIFEFVETAEQAWKVIQQGWDSY